MSPGILTALPHGDYLALDRLSPSGAKTILKSPAHYRAERETPRAETPALRIGSALHTLALEGRAAYEARFAVAPECDRRTKEGKTVWAEFQELAAGRTVLTASEAEPVEAMAASLARHPLIPTLLTGGQAEVSLIWEDPETGAPCKGRPDFARLADGVLLDLKTALDAAPAGFSRAALSYGYHVQGAAYRAGCEALGAPVADHLLLVVEKAAPFACAVYRLSDAAIELGARRWREAVDLYSQCLARNEWPGYSTAIQELSLPNWAMSELFIDQPED